MCRGCFKETKHEYECQVGAKQQEPGNVKHHTQTADGGQTMRPHNLRLGTIQFTGTTTKSGTPGTHLNGGLGPRGTTQLPMIGEGGVTMTMMLTRLESSIG